jgi:putative flippase GtrA
LKNIAFFVIFKKLIFLTVKGFINLKKIFVSKKFLEFCALGCINCLNDSIFSWLAEFIMQKNMAQIVGYLCGLTIAFFITCKLIFKAPPTLNRYAKFLVAYIPNFIIYFLMGFVTLNTLGLNQFLGTFLAAVAGGPITFIIIWVYTFSVPKTTKSLEDQLE